MAIRHRHRLLRLSAASVAIAAGAWALSACSPSATAGALHEAFAAEVAAHHVPGGALAVRTTDGTVQVFPVGVADDEGTAVTEDTLFAYRSVTKSFVTTTVLQLVDAGALGLDDVAATAGTGIETTATIAELGTMTSGVASYSSQPALIDLMVDDWSRSWTDTTLYSLTADLDEVFSPGTSYQYSNTNTVLLGQIVNGASHQSWEEAVHEGVVDPLGLGSVSYPGDTLPPEGVATGFMIDDDGTASVAPAVRASAFSAAGGLFGNAADLATWAEALGTGAVISTQAQEYRLSSFGPTLADPKSPYYDAYGFGIGRIGDWVGHTGNGLGYQALAMHHAATGTSVAIVLNGTGANDDVPADLLLELEALILAEADA